jgi:hypothetical protein
MKNKLSLYLLLSALIVVGFVAPVFADHHEGEHKEEHKDGEHHDGDHHEEKK